MKTHTIRKVKGGRILTFTPAFEEALLRAHPWALRLLVGRLLKETGTHLNHEQAERIEHAVRPVPETTYEDHLVLRWLEGGFRLLDAELPKLLAALDRALCRLLPETPAAPPATGG